MTKSVDLFKHKGSGNGTIDHNLPAPHPVFGYHKTSTHSNGHVSKHSFSKYNNGGNPLETRLVKFNTPGNSFHRSIPKAKAQDELSNLSGGDEWNEIEKYQAMAEKHDKYMKALR